MFWKYGKIGSGFVIAREQSDRGDLPLICRLFGYRVEVRYVGLKSRRQVRNTFTGTLH